MKRVRTAGTLLVLGFASLLAACAADGNRTLLILFNKPPENDCTIAATTGDIFVGAGTLDVETAGQPYIFSPVVRNSAEGTPGDANQRVVVLQGADVTIKPTSSSRSAEIVELLGPDLTDRTQYFSGTVAPSGGLAALVFPLIDTDQSNALRGALGNGELVQVLGSARVFGTLDGNDIASPYFDYPITLCKGCVAEPGEGEASCFGDQTPSIVEGM